MKKVNINIDLDSRKQANNYQFRLGNGTIYDFPSKRKATDFLNKTNKFLTESWYNLHNTYITIVQDYSSVTGYYYNTNKDKGFRFSDTKIRDILHKIDEIFHQIINSSSNTNGNYTVFSNLDKICAMLTRAVLNIKTIHTHKSNAQQLITCNFRISQINNLKNSISGWGLEMCTDIYEVTRVVEIPKMRVVNI